MTVSAPQALQLKLPPHSIEAEAAVLGSLMLDNASWEKVGDLITSSDFYKAEHKLIFQSVVRLLEQNKAADVVTVFESLKSSGQEINAGGIEYLNSIAQSSPAVSNIKGYAEIIRDQSILRRLVSVSEEISTMALGSNRKETRAILDEAEAKIFKISEDRSRGNSGLKDFDQLLTHVTKKISDLYENPNPSDVTGIPSGFLDLDQKTAGMHPGDLIIIAGRPSMGKTSLAINIAEYVAIDHGLPVAVFSMEMAAEQLVIRMLCSQGKIDAQRVRTGKLSQDDWDRLMSANASMKNAAIHIDESAGINPLEIRSRARRLKRLTGGLGLVIVDYLQLMSASGDGENRTTEISEITRSLKGLAKELECPVIALSQLNRTVEQRTDKRPVMSDLRESGSIEQDADVILFIYRDEVYRPETAEKGIAEIIISKQRNGPIGTIRLTFLGEFTRFENYSSVP
ncbi:MAG: replicative DNA helicase [Betaproteobacteria bacterium TMED41]|nr:MAG: replicative DNA helicase [Betaproteobacteria bacterium TMED41]|tara:strand:+ start:820 stop:2184 length:1365 start_codon:yes stop_codon:yes gene_type:complete